MRQLGACAKFACQLESRLLPQRSTAKHSSQVVSPTQRPCRSSHSLRCYGATSGRRSGLWDTTKAETTLRNARNAGKRVSASRSRSSLRARLRLANERRRRPNNALATRTTCSGWHFAGVAKSAPHYRLKYLAASDCAPAPNTLAAALLLSSFRNKDCHSFFSCFDTSA